MNRISQNMKVLNHLINIGPVTTWELIQTYHMTRPAARIKDLREEGWPIQTTMIYNKGEKHALYSIPKES